MPHEMTEENANELLAGMEAPSPEMAMEQPTQNEGQLNEKTPAQIAQEYSFKYGGKEIKAPIEKILRWAEQGYEAPQKIGDLNKQIESWKSKDTQLKELEGKYKTVDDYVRQNPDWFNYIQQEYNNRTSQQQQQAPNMNGVAELKSMFEQQKSALDSLLQDKEQARIKQEDEQYSQNFESIKKQYPKVDFNTADASGKSLEYKVLEYANKNGINNFTTAFKDFYFDDLIKLKEEEAKEGFMKNKQANSKLGILGISSTPSPKSKSGYVKGKTYDQLEQEALFELGLTT